MQLPWPLMNVYVMIMGTLFRCFAKTLAAIYGRFVPAEPVEPVFTLTVARYGSQGHT
jgi:hypothetical protein